MSEIIQLSRYTSNAVQGQKKHGTVYNNASDNLFSNYLNSLYNNSPTHQCIIDDIAQQVVGLGLTCPNKEDAAKLNEYFDKTKMLTIARGVLVQECVPLEVIRNPLKDIKKIKYVDAAHWRVADLDENDKPTRFAYRKEWNPKSNLYDYRSVYINSYNNEDLNSLLYYYDSGTYLTPYGRPSYLSATDAIELEYAIYKMHNHGAWNGMFPSMIISKETSGDPEQDRDDAEATRKQVTGPSNAGKLGFDFTRQGGTPATFFTPNLTGLDKIYENQYETAEIGILKAWRIPSANLISGLNSKGSGFTSETEELAFATERMRVKIIEPRREQLLDILSPIFSELEIEDVSFKDTEEVVTEVLSKQKDPLDELIEMGEDEAFYKDYEISSVMDVDYNLEEELDKKVSDLNKDFLNLATTGTAFPNASSEQDGTKGGVYYLVRYRYAGDATGQREFCNKMLRANKYYRKEDIVRMGDKPVNKGFGISGAATYPIWEYKGGVNCHHRWERVTFVKKGDKKFNVRNTQANKLDESMADERGMNPNNPKIVSTRPIDMPRKGAYFSKVLQKVKDAWI